MLDSALAGGDFIKISKNFSFLKVGNNFNSIMGTRWTDNWRRMGTNYALTLLSLVNIWCFTPRRSYIFGESRELIKMMCSSFRLLQQFEFLQLSLILRKLFD